MMLAKTFLTSIGNKINRNTSFNWKKKYSEMNSELLRRHKELEPEYAELKRKDAKRSIT